MSDVKVVRNHKSSLGEGPIWDYKFNRLLWVDINYKILYLYYPDEDREEKYELNGRPGTVVPESENTVVMGIETSFIRYNLKTGEYEKLGDVCEENMNIRFNDGKCDPKGRFFCGTMSTEGKDNQGALYILDNDLSIRKVIENVTTSNGLVWNKDNTKMFYIDSRDFCVYDYDYDIETGDISNKKICIDGKERNFKFDGMAIDSEDNLWIAHYGGAAVTCHNPYTGKMLDRINLTAKNTTACAIGGKSLDCLYITSAAQQMTKEEMRQYPDSGALFSVKIDAKGVKADYFVSSR